MSLRDCRACIRTGLQHPTVKFLREQMEKAGCTVWPRLFAAVNCTEPGVLAFYASGRGIGMCCNHMQVQDEINKVMIHELIHAYDDCRAKNLDWKNCAHHACSEIRAYHLSEACRHKIELLRYFMPVTECIKRSAFNSLQNNPYCHGEKGKDAIEDVWDICYNDAMPFDRAPSSNL